MLVCATCQTNLEELVLPFSTKKDEMIREYMEKNNIKNLALARGRIDISTDKLMDDLGISHNRWCCRAALMSTRSMLEMIGLQTPMTR